MKVAESVIGEVRAEYEPPDDPIECLRLLVERSGNTFLGVAGAGKYTLFAWTLRKVTREYLLEALYPTLKNEELKGKGICVKFFLPNIHAKTLMLLDGVVKSLLLVEGPHD
ncbi:MAG: hypothetical protein N3F04_05135 [Candidatus Nezhaarchaeota archaeon]|nr:hypothetical protein [Candidatus Nezhaarchaeota archaeon]MCX8142132.1 hypothetical protein [Candidatus Nezhaarchaeota archaeon]MDW8050087.1 hypothetical protein [Nitrososphaerota archaeon]